MSDTPPVARYRLHLTIDGNTLDEIESELTYQANGGFLLDSDHGKRDSWHVIGGRVASRMEHLRPDMTPERFKAELAEWWDARRAAKADR